MLLWVIEMETTIFLQAQSADYQHHAKQVMDLKSTLSLENQLNMELYQSIPKEYQPKRLKTSSITHGCDALSTFFVAIYNRSVCLRSTRPCLPSAWLHATVAGT